MITKQELEEILKDNGFSDTEVTKILNKKLRNAHGKLYLCILFDNFFGFNTQHNNF